ncbi:hypothetical protein O0I10_008274 [Lichtheimia ornata]|uniref:Major facilitator superfamily (MFS) profile domain-containing protein n=1 Tax=Lichtheimia ornata TaxID=688661 RepID=A0AAD7UYZ6_9FUNG|nr:uncharacterized protein O0I10_008274 [Lichtheimia ornata]KAJ8656052.1 hypothetical protein O0I10_008274 [Lichtheimia ornata]
MVWCAFIASIAGFNVGWHIGVPNMPQTTIAGCQDITDNGDSALPPCLPMSDFTWGYTVAAYPIGGLVGGLASKYLNVYFPRRTCMLIAAVWNVIGGILSATSINPVMYSFGRAFVGLGCGMSGSSVAIYISEISTNKSRGALGSFFEVFLNLGILLAQVCGLYMSYNPVWRVLWAIPSIIAALQIVFIIFTVVESPRRLCADQQQEKARYALDKLRNHTDIEEELEILLSSLAVKVEGMSIWEVISWKNKKITWNTVIVIVVQMYNQVGGIGPMSVYSVGFLTKAFGGDSVLATDVVLAQASANIVATLICIFTIHKVGRKGYMMISTLGQCIGCTFIVIASNVGTTEQMGPMIIVGALLFSLTYSTGCGVIPWLLAPELLPLKALAAGSALGNAGNWLMNFLVNILWPYIDAGADTYAFLVFVVINFIGFIFMTFCLPETTGRSLAQGDEDDPLSRRPSIHYDVEKDSKE